MEKSARLQFSSGFKKILVAFAVCLSLIGCKRVVESFGRPAIYEKDFMSGYLLAKALQAGVNPYVPLPELAQRFGQSTKMEHLDHPTPHTVAMGWLCYPFAWLPYEKAAVAWLLFELVCLVVAVRLLLLGLGVELSPQRWLIGCGVALAWIPVVDDLFLGQFSLCLLVMWLCVWHALRDEQDARGGLWLGVMITLKLVGWPVVLWLAWRRRWRGVLAAGAMAAALHLVAIGLHGWTTMRDYYLKVGPLVSAFYRTHDANYSLWTFGARMFAPFGLNFATASPLQLPLMAKLLSVALPVAVLAIGLWFAQREREFDVAFGLLVCVSLLVNPIAWTHYLMTTCIVIGLILQRLALLDWPRVWAHRLMLIALPLSLTQTSWALMVIALATHGVAAGRPQVSFWASWLTVVPSLAVMGLGWLLWRVNQLTEQPETAEAQPWANLKAVSEWSPSA
jgi:Glycosyltransferase family 87